MHSLFAETLEPRGFEVVAALDPEQGVAKAKELEPALVFISLLFPGSNGLKVSKLIHAEARLNHVPIVMLTSYHGELDPKYTSTIGVLGVLVKPPAPEAIVETTIDLLGGAAALPDVEEIALAGTDTGELEELQIDEEIEYALPGEEAFLSDKEPGPFSSVPEEVAPGANYIDKSGAGPFPQEERGGLPAREDVGGFVSSDAETAQKGDDTISFLTEEDAGATSEAVPEEGERSIFEEHMAGKKSSRKKATLAAAVVLMVVGLGLAAYQVRHIFPRQGKETSQARPALAVKPSGGGPIEKEAIREQNDAGPVKTAESVGHAGPAEETTGTKASALPAAPEEKTGPSHARAAKHTETNAFNEGLKGQKEQPRTTQAVFSVQVGAFGSEKNALSLVSKLKQKGYDAAVRKAPGEGLHRVLIGRFGDRKEAQKMAEEISRKEGIKSLIYQH